MEDLALCCLPPNFCLFVFKRLFCSGKWALVEQRGPRIIFKHAGKVSRADAFRSISEVFDLFLSLLPLIGTGTAVVLCTGTSNTIALSSLCCSMRKTKNYPSISTSCLIPPFKRGWWDGCSRDKNTLEIKRLERKTIQGPTTSIIQWAMHSFSERIEMRVC